MVPQVRIGALHLSAVLLLTFGAALPARADGELDLSFSLFQGYTAVFYSDAGAVFDAIVETGGQLDLAGIEASGISVSNVPPPIFSAQLTPVGMMKAAGVTFAQQAVANPFGLVLDAAGNFYVDGINFDSGGNLNAAVALVDASGVVKSTYLRAAASATDGSGCASSHPLLDSHGRLVVACFRWTASGAVSPAVLRLIIGNNQTLTPDAAFGVDGWVILGLPSGQSAGRSS